jgi:hypothetical protein
LDHWGKSSSPIRPPSSHAIYACLFVFPTISSLVFLKLFPAVVFFANCDSVKWGALRGAQALEEEEKFISPQPENEAEST